VAREALAELAEASDNEQPYFWIGRLKTALRSLADGWPAADGLNAAQREVLGQALADAIDHRTPTATAPTATRDSRACATTTLPVWT
jgi:hypothetical protein